MVASLGRLQSCRNEAVKILDHLLDKGRNVAGDLEGGEALAGVKIFQHVQKELVEKLVLLGGDESGLGLIIVGLEAVLRVVLLEVKQAACHRGVEKKMVMIRARRRARGYLTVSS